MARRSSSPTISLVDELKTDLEALIEEAGTARLTGPARKKINERIEEIRRLLDQLVTEIDPIKLPDSLFDPSDPQVVGRFVALALVAQERHPLRDFEDFYGSGVYAIYYRGQFKEYSRISATETPIYVGKADPAVGNARDPIEQGDRLSRRLKDHKNSISKPKNLDVSDFEYRALVVQSGWQTAAESYLIQLFQPVWNSETNILYGIGKHGDSAKTRANKRSPWDTLHPGRAWAADTSLVDAKSRQQIRAELKRHFSSHLVYTDIEDVLSEFIEELRQV